MKLKIQSIKDYFKSKKDRGLKPIFFEKIADNSCISTLLKIGIWLKLDIFYMFDKITKGTISGTKSAKDFTIKKAA